MKNSILNKKMSDVVECVELYNKALAANEAMAVNTAEIYLKNAEKAYEKAKTDEVYAECGRQEKPVLYTINMYSYTILTHTTERDKSGVIVSAKISETEKIIDFYNMCKANNISTEWAAKTEDLYTSFLLRESNPFGFINTTCNSLCSSRNYQIKAAQHAAAVSDSSKKDPLSKKSMIAELQSVVDSVFGLNGVAAGTYKVTSHDFEYIHRIFFKKGKNVSSLSILDLTSFRCMIFDVLCRLYKGLTYSIESEFAYKEENITEKENESSKISEYEIEEEEIPEDEKMLLEMIRKAYETPSVSIINTKKYEEAKNAMSLIVAFFEASKTFPEDTISYNNYESGVSMALRVITDIQYCNVPNLRLLMQMLPDNCNIEISPTTDDRVSFEFTFTDVKRRI